MLLVVPGSGVQPGAPLWVSASCSYSLSLFIQRRHDTSGQGTARMGKTPAWKGGHACTKHTSWLSRLDSSVPLIQPGPRAQTRQLLT